MSDPALAVQGAYVVRLKSQVTAVSSRVHDRPPQNVAFPFLQIGDIQTVEDGADCIDGTEVTVTLHAWSRDVGAVEARNLAGACRLALHEWIPDLSASGFRCVEHMHRDSRVMTETDGLTCHAIMTFRLLIDRL